MTFAPPDGPRPQLSTTRVASGTSARLVAVAVAGVLVAVVGFAVVNRPARPAAPRPTSAPVAVVPTPAAPPTPPPTQPEGNGGSGAPLPPIDNQPRVYSYAVSMNITSGLLRAVLKQQVVEDFGGSVVIESADIGKNLVVELGRQWGQDGLTIFESFGTWAIALKPLRKSRGRVELLVVHQPPSLDPGVPGPTAAGYTFTVLGRRDGTHLTLFMDLVWPVASQPETYGGPRGPGLFNRCRWDAGPQAAAPRGTQDEASCAG